MNRAIQLAKLGGRGRAALKIGVETLRALAFAHFARDADILGTLALDSPLAQLELFSYVLHAHPRNVRANWSKHVERAASAATSAHMIVVIVLACSHIIEVIISFDGRLTFPAAGLLKGFRAAGKDKVQSCEDKANDGHNVSCQAEPNRFSHESTIPGCNDLTEAQETIV